MVRQKVCQQDQIVRVVVLSSQRHIYVKEVVKNNRLNNKNSC